MFNNAYDLLYVVGIEPTRYNPWDWKDHTKINSFIIYLFIYFKWYTGHFFHLIGLSRSLYKSDPFNRCPIAIQIFFVLLYLLQSLDSVHTSKSNYNISVKSNTKANKRGIVKQLTWAYILCIIIQRLDLRLF